MLNPWQGKPGIDLNGNPVELSVNDDAQTAAVIFKTVVDPFVGKLLYFKVVSGTVKPDTLLLNTRTGVQEKIGKVFTVRGKKQEEAAYIWRRGYRRGGQAQRRQYRRYALFACPPGGSARRHVRRALSVHVGSRQKQGGRGKNLLRPCPPDRGGSHHRLYP